MLRVLGEIFRKTLKMNEIPLHLESVVPAVIRTFQSKEWSSLRWTFQRLEVKQRQKSDGQCTAHTVACVNSVAISETVLWLSHWLHRATEGWKEEKMPSGALLDSREWRSEYGLGNDAFT